MIEIGKNELLKKGGPVMSMRTVLMTLVIGVLITLGIIVLVRFVPVPGLSSAVHKAERTLLPESVARKIDPASVDGGDATDQPPATTEKKTMTDQ